MHDARQVANFLLDYADDKSFALTNMAILKHIYFAHGWHLASHGTPLISNRFEAWEYGPVVRSVYDCFKSFGPDPVTSRAETMNWETGELIQARGAFSRETTAIIQWTFKLYTRYGAFELSEITHEPDGPWDRVWNARDGKVRLNMEISTEVIRDHFVRQLNTTSIQ